MKKRRILMGKTHLIAGAVMLAVAGGQLSAQTVAPKKAKAYMVADAHLDTAVELGHSDYYSRIMFGIP